ncbi:hypothetical protein AQUCO_03900116v1 [Aquilegia coerulea]|uniref:Fe2OG dioxygenase domain-containing protein n=1 Tax=Aquilegia coerulea TaxID=218851 RepID=A0A2G5CRS9_AQUCA|nr:hypothetical protein AQUCO_03900116v1 [Aquilegia coerulea]
MTTSISSDNQQSYDRIKEVKKFDDSKIGVKGLIDSGITSIPSFFIHSPETLPTPNPTTNHNTYQIPIVDLSDSRSIIIDQINQASQTLGFFQITNHDIPLNVLNRMIESVKEFNEQSTDVKSRYYTREMGRGVSFSTNFDLFTSKAASWRDTLQVKLGPTPIDTDLLPEICKIEVIEWDQHIVRLGETLMGILSEALGLTENKLKDLSFLENRLMVAHYYPYCPQPDRTVGITPHTDPGVLTILLQDQIGGLQVKHGEDWINVEPIEGALVINIGDILQMVTNGRYKSVEHRVLANPNKQPRISVGVFFNPSNREELYGPLDELVSQEKPAIYRRFTLKEFMGKLFARGLDGKSLIDNFKV